MEDDERSSHSPLPNPNSSSVFKDISNFKTPKRPTFQIPNNQSSPYPHFFSASKQTPSSSYSSSFRRRPSSVYPTSRSKAARKLKTFELEQSQSSRKEQNRKTKSLKSLSNSLTVWLNFLFENPKLCGCDLSVLAGADGVEESGRNFSTKKRDSGVGIRVSTDGPLRTPKRQKDSGGSNDGESVVFSSSMFSSLKVSMEEVCSLDDLMQRMRAYLSLDSCKGILSVMSKVAKNIDEGRLKMKAHCPIVTDVGMKAKAISILMSYNPTWLQIGLYIVFGGDSLMPNGVDSDQDRVFLKMVVEKQFFSHASLAKTYAYNRLVDGLYRPGYFEALGNVILKRILLLVLVLDRAKSLSSLPITYGIDGTDGGSPLLFGRQSNIKSSRQVICDFLSSEVMHGEGNLLSHLMAVGYKLSYQQNQLLEYDFRMTDLFKDLQDGVRLCRAVQLLQCDHSVLMKMVVPSDNRKKNLVNCGLAMQYLKNVGVPLSDEDGVTVVADDVATGDKELTLSILWNMFIHLQLPLLIDKTLLSEEISKVRGAEMDCSMSITSSSLELLLEWIQSICQKYDLKVESFTSLVDGKVMWCLIDYYFRKELHSACSYKKVQNIRDEVTIPWTDVSTDAVHNFIISQKLTTILGNFPEVLQISDILEHKGACNERSVIILLVFLSSQLIGRKNMDLQNIHKLLGCSCRSPDRKGSSSIKCFLSVESPDHYVGLDDSGNEDSVEKFKIVQAWWRDMIKQNHECETKDVNPSVVPTRKSIDAQREKAAKVIQSRFRGFIVRQTFLKIKATTSFLQTVFRAWLMVKSAKASNKFNLQILNQLSFESHKHPINLWRYLRLMIERHSFIMLKKSVLLIQNSARAWITRRHHRFVIDGSRVSILQESVCRDTDENLQIVAATKIQLAWKTYTLRRLISNQSICATKVQSQWRGWLMRRKFLQQKRAIIKIQSHFRGLISRRRVDREMHSIIMIQSHWRYWLMRRGFLQIKEAAIKIQSSFRGVKCRKEFSRYRFAAIDIQRCLRGQLSRKRLLGAYSLGSATRASFISAYHNPSCVQSLELKILFCSVLRLQRWWKRVLILKSSTRSAIILQSHIRGWLARRKAKKAKNQIVVVQSYWRGYLARKESRGQLLDLRLRVKKSALTVDDSMRLINRLVVALSELLSNRSVSNVLHICRTLDIATQHSQKCCETLVAAGATKTLLKLMSSVTRSIPDQEVLKHALSTLRNLIRYPDLAQVLVDTERSLELIFAEFLRNKEEAFFIASEILKKLCTTATGIIIVRKQPAYLKRLRGLVEELKRKVNMEKRNPRYLTGKDQNEKRLKEAVDLLKLINKILE